MPIYTPANYQKTFPVINYGAIPGIGTRTDGATTVNSAVFTSTGGVFGSVDVGKSIYIFNASANASLTTALVATTVYTSLTVTAVRTAIPITTSIVIGYGATTQTVVTSAAVAVNATSIPVTSFTANAAYAIGSPITAAILYTTIISVQSATSITLNTVALATTNSVTYAYGFDAAPAIQSAIAAAGAVNGGIVSIGPGTFFCCSTINLNSPGVVIVGAALTGNDSSGPTKLSPGNPAMYQLISVSNGATLVGSGLSNLIIDASNGVITGPALQLQGAQYGEYSNLNIIGANGLSCITTAAATASNTMHNQWKKIFLRPGTTNGSVGILISGNYANNSYNTCYENFDDLTIAWQAAAAGVTIKAIWLQAADNIQMRNVHMYGIVPIGTNVAVQYDYSGTGAGNWPSDTYIQKIDMGGNGVTVLQTGTPSANATLNRIIGISGTNGKPTNPNAQNLQFDEPTLSQLLWVHRDAALSTAVGVNQPIIYQTSAAPGYDLSGNYNSTTGKYTAPKAGYYRVIARASVNSQVRMFTSIFVNASETIRGQDYANTSIGSPGACSWVEGVVKLAVGDLVSIGVYTSAIAALEVGASTNFMQIQLAVVI